MANRGFLSVKSWTVGLIAFGFCVISYAVPSITLTGDNYPTDSGDWTAVNINPAIVGWNNDGTIYIPAGATVDSLYGYLGLNEGATGTATISGIDALWDSTYFYVGGTGTGDLTIENGGKLQVYYDCYVGDNPGSAGDVTIDGSASMLEARSVSVGYEGNGTMTVTNGGTVNAGLTIASYAGTTGDVTLTGSGTNVTTTSSVNIGSGTGTLAVVDGAVIQADGGMGIAASSNTSARGTVTVSGAGSALDLGDLAIGDAPSGETAGIGELNVTGGALVQVDGNVDVNTGSTLSIEITGNNMLTSETGKLIGGGLVKLTAAPTLAAGIYQPLDIDGLYTFFAGTYVAVGGTWNPYSGGGSFTVSEPVSGTAGVQAGFNLTSAQRFQIGNDMTMGFTSGTGTVSVLADRFSGSELDNLSALIDPGEQVLDGWDFTISGYVSDSETMLSYNVGTGYDPLQFEIWHFNGSNWNSYTPVGGVSYNNGWVGFLVDGFSGYAVTGILDVTPIPEPSSILVLFLGGLLLSRRRCKFNF